jgi:hypothetical protein
MYLMYVDESGDPGNSKLASPHYVLSGLIVNVADWEKCLQRLKTFRKSISETYKLSVRAEIHTSELIRVDKILAYRKIVKKDRISIMRDYAAQLPIIFDTAKIINICINKASHGGVPEFQTMAWNRLITRYDTFLKKSVKDRGIIIADDSNEITLRNLLRKMRIYNPIKSHYQGYYNAPVDSIIEDIFYRSSKNSYFIQSIDLVAHLLYRKEYPKGSLKKYGVEKMFNKIEAILLKEAASGDPFGIVRN